MTEPDALHARLAARLRELRAERGLSLDALATRSGVSRSMISLIERAESSPTAAVLEKLASALGLPLARLFEPAGLAEPEPLARRADQPEWLDPESGYRRRNVSPPGMAQPMQIVEVQFPAGARVAFDSIPQPPLYQQVWLLAGRMDITLGERRYELREGDCLAMVLDQPIVFHNPSRQAARYAVVVGTDPRRHA